MNNKEFINAIFGNDSDEMLATGFTYPPDAIPPGESDACWSVEPHEGVGLSAGQNQYFCVSTFHANRRQEEFFKACYVIGIDDVGEKTDSNSVMSQYGLPSIILKSSSDSEQWFYILDVPCTNSAEVKAVQRHIIKTCFGSDPGMMGVNRMLRLPGGINNKKSRGSTFDCKVVRFNPDLKFHITHFGADLNNLEPEARQDSSHQPDHPIRKHLHEYNIRDKGDGRLVIDCPWADEHTNPNDKSGACVFTGDDVFFKCHHGHGDLYTGGSVVSLFPGLKEEMMFGGLVVTATAPAPPEYVEDAPLLDTALDRLNSMSALNCLDELVMQGANEHYVLPGIALYGQTTVIYASPNAGKTLISLSMLIDGIENHGVDGAKVFYINVDDTRNGRIEKLKLAKSYGFNTLLNNVSGFTTKKLSLVIRELIEVDQADGVVFILDTMKKFTDLMDKRVSSDFGNLTREFTESGGTIIEMAHVNKNKNAEGKSIFGGTTDAIDDCDCAYIIDVIDESHMMRTAEYTNIKSRGDNIETLSVQYSITPGSSYPALIKSVQVMTDDQTEIMRKSAAEKGDSVIIDAVQEVVDSGASLGRKAMVDLVKSKTGESKPRVESVLMKYEGSKWLYKNKDDGNFEYTNMFDLS